MGVGGEPQPKTYALNPKPDRPLPPPLAFAFERAGESLCTLVSGGASTPPLLSARTQLKRNETTTGYQLGCQLVQRKERHHHHQHARHALEALSFVVSEAFAKKKGLQALFVPENGCPVYSPYIFSEYMYGLYNYGPGIWFCSPESVKQILFQEVEPFSLRDSLQNY